MKKNVNLFAECTKTQLSINIETNTLIFLRDRSTYFLADLFPSLILALLFMLSSCEKDELLLKETTTDYESLVSSYKDQEAIPNPMDCLYRDCAKDTNPLIQSSQFKSKSNIPLSGLYQTYHESASLDEHYQRFSNHGFPAWNQILSVDISSSYRHYLVPVYKRNSDRVASIISFGQCIKSNGHTISGIGS